MKTYTTKFGSLDEYDKGTLDIIDADDATMTVECSECSDTYEVEEIEEHTLSSHHVAPLMQRTLCPDNGV